MAVKVMIVTLPKDARSFNVMSKLIISHFQKYRGTNVTLKKTGSKWALI
jgi:hypothetical protein